MSKTPTIVSKIPTVLCSLDPQRSRVFEINSAAHACYRKEIEKNEYNLNISRYVSTAIADKEIVLGDVHKELVEIEDKMTNAKAVHNRFLKELGLSELP